MPDEFMTKEQFGLDLYEAIRLNAARIQALKNQAMFTGKGLPAKAHESAQAAKNYDQELQHLLGKGTIPPDAVRRILAMS